MLVLALVVPYYNRASDRTRMWMSAVFHVQFVIVLLTAIAAAGFFSYRSLKPYLPQGGLSLEQYLRVSDVLVQIVLPAVIYGLAFWWFSRLYGRWKGRWKLLGRLPVSRRRMATGLVISFLRPVGLLSLCAQVVVVAQVTLAHLYLAEIPSTALGAPGDLIEVGRWSFLILGGASFAILLMLLRAPLWSAPLAVILAIIGLVRVFGGNAFLIVAALTTVAAASVLLRSASPYHYRLTNSWRAADRRSAPPP